MKPSWVLSDEERNRRFNKFNKLNVKSVNPEDRKSRPAAASQLRLPELYMTFTMEEQKLIDDIQKKFTFCHQAWLRNLLIFGRFCCDTIIILYTTVIFLSYGGGGGGETIFTNHSSSLFKF